MLPQLINFLPRWGVDAIGEEIKKLKKRNVTVTDGGIILAERKIPWSRLCALHLRKHGIMEMRLSINIDPVSVLDYTTQVRDLDLLVEQIEDLSIVNISNEDEVQLLINHDLAIRRDFLPVINHPDYAPALRKEAFVKLRSSYEVSYTELEGHALKIMIPLIHESEHEPLFKHAISKLNKLVAGGDPYITILEKLGRAGEPIAQKAIEAYHKRAADFIRRGLKPAGDDAKEISAHPSHGFKLFSKK